MKMTGQAFWAFPMAALVLVACERQPVPEKNRSLIEVLEEIASDNSITLGETERGILMRASASENRYNGVVKMIHADGRAFGFRNYADGRFGDNTLVLWYREKNDDRWFHFAKWRGDECVSYGNDPYKGQWRDGLWDSSTRLSRSRLEARRRADGLAKVALGSAVVARFRNEFPSSITYRTLTGPANAMLDAHDWGKEVSRRFPHRSLESLAVYLSGHLEVAVGWKPDGSRSETLVVDGNGTLATYHKNGQLRSRSIWKNGLETGFAEQWYEDGAKKEDALWEDGKLEGLTKRWLPNGKLEEEGSYRNGKREGDWLRNGLVGGKPGEGTFQQDEGVWTSWHQNGQKWRESHYVAEEKHGPWNAWYANGKKGVEGHYDQGAQVGEWTHWHENGTKAGEGAYKKGIKIGQWIYWDENGTELARESRTGGRFGPLFRSPPLPSP